MEKIRQQLQELKASNDQLKQLKQAEASQHKEYFKNCKKVVTMLKDKRKDFVLESLSQIDASVSAISSDVQAFKNIRNRLFAQITDEIQKEQAEAAAQGHSRSSSNASQTKTLNNNKLYLYLFHLFESVVSNTAQLVNKTMHSTLSQCGELGNLAMIDSPREKKRNTITDTINTIASGSIIDGENKQGFFSENVKMIQKSSKNIEKAIDQITGELIAVNATGLESRLMHEKVQKFIAQLPEVNTDNSFEVRWSLSELEEIVFDFINAHELPPEFKVGTPKVNVKTKTVKFSKEAKQDVCEEDLMNVIKTEKKDDNLQMIVRDYILHDRGNSLFLGDSFGNLPSPVNEDASIKKLFKFNDDEPLDKKRGNASQNQAIRIEGKKDKKEEVVKASPGKIPQKDFQVDLEEIDKIVFVDTMKGKAYGDPSNRLPAITALGQASSNQGAANQADKKKLSKENIKPYEEEESYENPVNISKAPGCQEDYVDLQSEYVLDPNKVNLSMQIINQSFINQSIINQSQESEAIVQISNLMVDESALKSYQLLQNEYSKSRSNKCNVKDDDSSSINTIKLLKDDIVVGGQKGPGVKITKSSKGIRIGQSSQINAQVAKKDPTHEQNKMSDPKAKYGTIESSSTGRHKINIEKSPRAVGLNPNHQSTETERAPGQNELMNSSCKDTVRMNERREFSFIEQMSQDRANLPQQPNEYFLVQNTGQNGISVNDTVSLLKGLNSSQRSKQEGILYGPDGNPLNPFISDSYLFQNSTNPNNETNNFGVNSSEQAYHGLAFANNYHTVQGSQISTSGQLVFTKDAKVQPFVNQRNSVGSAFDSLKKAPMVFPSSDVNLALQSGKHQTPNPPKSQTTLSKSASKKLMTQNSSTSNSRNMSRGLGKKNSLPPQRQFQVPTVPTPQTKKGQGNISSIKLQQLNKSVSQRIIEHPASISPSNKVVTPVVHASLGRSDSDNAFELRTGSVDNYRNITKVGNNKQSSVVKNDSEKKQVICPVVQRQKQNPVATSNDYPGSSKGVNPASAALKAVLNQRSAQVPSSGTNPQRSVQNGLFIQQYNEDKSKSFLNEGLQNNQSNSFKNGHRGLTAVQSQPSLNVVPNSKQSIQALRDTEKSYDFYTRNQSVGAVSSQTGGNTAGSNGINNSTKVKRRQQQSVVKKTGGLNQSVNQLNQGQYQPSQKKTGGKSTTTYNTANPTSGSNAATSLPKINK